jgi:hypothetical protein
MAHDGSNTRAVAEYLPHAVSVGNDLTSASPRVGANGQVICV